MSLWQRLFGSKRTASDSATTPARRKADAASTDDSLRRLQKPMAPGGSLQADEELLVTYTRRIGVLDERPERCDPACVAALERRWHGEHEAPAIALGGALASALPRHSCAA